ncbi:MAG TPA: hypothetical protein VN310_05590 [Candidatus Dormibacteraeota bacterium]|nr:hypothetical protein [Candidatus Dormibacteraeota bacterium]
MQLFCFEQFLEIATCNTTMSEWHDYRSGSMMKSNSLTSMADVLEREVEPTIKEWLRRVNLVPELIAIPLSDEDRTGHLPKLYFDLVSRLRLAKDAPPPISTAAAAHGQTRRKQGYSASMLIEESRVFQVATFGTLHLHQSELNQDQLLLDVMVIADEVDAQLAETVRSLMGAKPAEVAA